MDVSSIAKLATSVAETGIKQEVGVAVMKRTQDIQKNTAAQLLNAIQPSASPQNLPPNLGRNINTTA